MPNFQLYSYLQGGIYANYLKHWMNYFSKEQFCIIQSETFFQDPKSTLENIFTFLDVSNFELSDFKKMNVGQYTNMDTKIRNRLKEFFQSYNPQLYEFFGKKSDWDS